MSRSLQYSLLSRFQGTLLGSTLGKMWGDREESLKEEYRLDPPRPSLEGLWWGMAVSPGENSTLAGDRSLTQTIAESLIQQGSVPLEEFKAAIAFPVTFDAFSVQRPLGLEELGLKTSQFDLNGFHRPTLDTEVWMATLPIALFFHEDGAKLHHNLRQVATAIDLPSSSIDGVLAVGYAIAQALNETLDPKTLLPQTLSYLQTLEASPILMQPLIQVQTWLEQGVGLEATTLLSDRHGLSKERPFAQLETAIALAFYYFLSTPEDFQISVMRSLRNRCSPPLTAAIVGALSGAYNSPTSIPLAWRMTVDTDQETKLLQLATQLYAAWSGVCDVTQMLETSGSFLAVTAPGIMRPR